MTDKAWVQGVPTPLATGSLSPDEQAVALLAGFASGRVTMEGDSIKHLPDVPVKTISQMLSEVWGTPKQKSRPVLQSKVPKRESKKTIAHQLAEEKPLTRIPDSEIKPENRISGSPLFIPFKQERSKGKGEHSKTIKIPISNLNSEMPCRKHTKTKAELKLEAKNRVIQAWHSTDAVKKAIPKPHKMSDTSKPPHQQLAAKAPQKQAPMKPPTHYALIVMQEIHRFQKSVDLLIPLLLFQQLVCKITQDFRMSLHFQSSAILALQEATEACLIQLFESANLCVIHCGQQTIVPKDFCLVWAIII